MGDGYAEKPDPSACPETSDDVAGTTHRERSTSMSINRRIVVTAVHTMELRKDPIPAPAPGEVRARSTYIGVCGSDTHAFHGRHPFIPIPYLPGHEATGVVEELGV